MVSLFHPLAINLGTCKCPIIDPDKVFLELNDEALSVSELKFKLDLVI